MPLQVVSIATEAAKVPQPFMPINLARVNDMALNLFICEGPFQWHRHDDQDEIFYVYEGEMLLETEIGNVVLRTGELVMSPANVPHHPSSLHRALVLYILKFITVPRNGHGRLASSEYSQLPDKVNVADATAGLLPYAPTDLARCDDFVMRAIVCQGWDDSPLPLLNDRLYLVQAGEVCIEIGMDETILKAGELVVVPRGTEHRLFARERAVLLTLERAEE